MSATVSTASLTGALRSPIQMLQVQLTKAQTELASGRHADVGLLLGGRTANAASLHAVRTRLDAYATANGLASTRLTATQSALTDVLDRVQGLQKTVVAAQAGTATMASLKAQGQSALSRITAALNTNAAGQYLFAGINTDVKPFGDSGAVGAAAVTSAFTSAFGVAPSDPGATAITPAAMQAFLDGPFAQQFASPSWQGAWSSASDTAITSRISPTQVAATSATANDAAVRDVIQGVALLSQLGNANLSADTRQVVLTQASNCCRTPSLRRPTPTRVPTNSSKRRSARSKSPILRNCPLASRV